MKKAAMANSAVFVLSVLIELGSFIVLSILVMNNSKIAATNSIREVTKKNVLEISQSIVNEQNLLKSLTKFCRLESGYVDPDIKEFVASYGLIDVMIADMGGRSLFSQNEKKHIIYYKPFLDGHTHVSDSYYGISGISQVTIEVPIYNEKTLAGAIYGTYPSNRFYPLHMRTLYDGKGISCIVNANGKIVLPVPEQTDPTIRGNLFDLLNTKENSVADRDAFRLSLESDQMRVMRLSLDGEDSFLCNAPVPGMFKWQFVSIVPKSVLIKEAQRISQLMIIACIIVALSVIAHFRLRLSILRKFDQETTALETLDELTGIYNFSGFCRVAERILLENRSFSYGLMYSDIKQFRYINDTYGLEAGDAVLRHIARVFKSNGTDIVQARVSGDVFLTLFPFSIQQDIYDHFDAIEPLICDMRDILAEKSSLALYSGVYCINKGVLLEGIKIREMADKANIAHKEARKNPESALIIYTEEMMDKKRETLFLENHMQSALENGEFVIYLQPKFELIGNTVVGAEALVRWIQPERGLIMPGHFIPLFEDNGFISKLDRYMMAQCCMLLEKWKREGYKCPRISVNVSRKLISENDFIYAYTDMKRQYAIPDNDLELEFTESLILDNKERMREYLIFLRSNGFLCAIDDFGSGYSSLNMLKDLPVDVLKLDRVFFERGVATERERIVIKSIIDMAKELSIQTVAEGIDNMPTVEFLKEHNCDIVQGFIFSKPIPVAEFEEKYLKIA